MKSLLLLLTLASLCPQALGWAGGGHKIIAWIAWAHVSPATREKVSALLAQHPEYGPHFQHIMAQELGSSATQDQQRRWHFAQAAIWPDHVRPPLDGSANPNEKYHRATWHYLDLPVYADDEARSKLPPPRLFWTWKPGLPEFIEQRLTAAQAVDKAHQLIPDATQSRQEQAVLL
jgi:hypothetical protein